MKCHILFCFYILLRFGILAKDTRIVGGSDADAREFPYTVSLRRIPENVIFCNGAIISQKHILTTAQCSVLYALSPELTKIYTGRTPSSSLNGPSFKIDKVFIHPEYTGKATPQLMYINDISVIKVVEIIEFNEFQNKIGLSIYKNFDGTDCIMTGWGSITYPENTKPVTLRKATVIIMNSVACFNQIDFALHPAQLCAFQHAGVSSANGDSGGPLVYDNKLVGLASFNRPGAQGFLEIFTNIFFYDKFIRESMEY